MKPWLKAALTIIIVGGLTGGLTYYFVNAKATDDKNNLQSQIDDLSTKLATAQQSLTDAQTLADETADWKTYTSSTYGFSFKYPADWHYASANGFPDTIFFSTSAISFPTESEGPVVPITVSIYSNVTVQDKVNETRSDYNLSDFSQTTVTIGNNILTKISGVAGSGSIIEDKQLEEFFIQKDNTLIQFTFISKLNVEADTFEQIISTFQFTD